MLLCLISNTVVMSVMDFRNFLVRHLQKNINLCVFLEENFACYEESRRFYEINVQAVEWMIAIGE